MNYEIFHLVAGVTLACLPSTCVVFVLFLVLIFFHGPVGISCFVSSFISILKVGTKREFSASKQCRDH